MISYLYNSKRNIYRNQITTWSLSDHNETQLLLKCKSCFSQLSNCKLFFKHRKVLCRNHSKVTHNFTKCCNIIVMGWWVFRLKTRYEFGFLNFTNLFTKYSTQIWIAIACSCNAKNYRKVVLSLLCENQYSYEKCRITCRGS